MTCLLCEDIEDVLYEVGLWCPMCKEEEEWLTHEPESYHIGPEGDEEE